MLAGGVEIQLAVVEVFLDEFDEIVDQRFFGFDLALNHFSQRVEQDGFADQIQIFFTRLNEGVFPKGGQASVLLKNTVGGGDAEAGKQLLNPTSVKGDIQILQILRVLDLNGELLEGKKDISRRKLVGLILYQQLALTLCYKADLVMRRELLGCVRGLVFFIDEVFDGNLLRPLGSIDKFANILIESHLRITPS